MLGCVGLDVSDAPTYLVYGDAKAAVSSTQRAVAGL